MTPAGSAPSQPPLRGVARLPENPEVTGSDAPPSPQVAHPVRAPTGLDTPQQGEAAEGGNDSRGKEAPDAFETSHAAENLEDSAELGRASVDLDDLPIELITLTDGFIETLTAKVHATPPSIDKLSQLFQDFYALAASHVATHINALASRQSRSDDDDADASARSSPSFSSAASRLRAKKSSRAAKEESQAGKSLSEQQMITAEQLADRKRARKALEAKRNLLEEAVERRLCEGIYHRIHRHRSTHDEVQDAKLRSKTAALALVGIGLADLGVDTISEPSRASPSATDQPDDVREWLAQARADLVAMAESRYPLGKLSHLKAAHKSIVDTLAHFHPSASADEIMPMLIYTLITMPPEKVYIISDLHFIKNFRWQPKLTGEAAYCLTNLEAAISFLQTVDLATLRADEQPSGPAKAAGAQPDVPKADTFPPAYPQGLADAPPPATASSLSKENAAASKPAPSPAGLMASNVLRNRGLSDLVNTPAQAFGAASGAVFSTADQGLKTISISLGDSYSFLLGKLRERQHGRSEASIAVPRTLDDARKLVSTPPPDDDDSASTTTAAENTLPPRRPPPQHDDRVLSMIGGRRDVAIPANGPKAAIAADERKPSAPSAPSAQSPAVLEQVRNFGSSFNPMARLSSIGMMRSLGRSLTTPAVPAPKDELAKTSDGGDLASAFPDIAAALPPKQALRLAPPRRRFMELQNPGDLRLSEVLDLLRDYHRLAGALKDLGAFEEKR